MVRHERTWPPGYAGFPLPLKNASMPRKYCWPWLPGLR
jgi:hypothetical protein